MVYSIQSLLSFFLQIDGGRYQKTGCGYRGCNAQHPRIPIQVVVRQRPHPRKQRCCIGCFCSRGAQWVLPGSGGTYRCCCCRCCSHRLCGAASDHHVLYVDRFCLFSPRCASPRSGFFFVSLLVLLLHQLAARRGNVRPHRPPDGHKGPVRLDDVAKLQHVLVGGAPQLVLDVRRVVGDEVDHQVPVLAELAQLVGTLERRRFSLQHDVLDHRPAPRRFLYALFRGVGLLPLLLFRNRFRVGFCFPFGRHRLVVAFVVAVAFAVAAGIPPERRSCIPLPPGRRPRPVSRPRGGTQRSRPSTASR
mmetsp:Transcript_15354/g.34848  ORF Transcript_15354/g.34848 Transcript_15354/m.34848 type:complete len:304 (+) Transcript_15354:42-953(+)